VVAWLHVLTKITRELAGTGVLIAAAPAAATYNTHSPSVSLCCMRTALTCVDGAEGSTLLHLHFTKWWQPAATAGTRPAAALLISSREPTLC
jgi:hypothetical protein